MEGDLKRRYTNNKYKSEHALVEFPWYRQVLNRKLWNIKNNNKKLKNKQTSSNTIYFQRPPQSSNFRSAPAPSPASKRWSFDKPASTSMEIKILTRLRWVYVEGVWERTCWSIVRVISYLLVIHHYVWVTCILSFPLVPKGLRYSICLSALRSVFTHYSLKINSFVCSALPFSLVHSSTVACCDSQISFRT